MIKIDWSSSTEITERKTLLRAKFMLNQAQKDAALKADCIIIDGVKYEVPVKQLINTPPGIFTYQLTQIDE